MRVAEKFSQDERAPNSPVCVLYYMLISGGFAAACLQTIAKGGSSILGRPGQTRAMSRTSTTRRPVHTLTTVEGLRSSFHHGLHGAVGMIFYAHAVYVVICYMSIICYMPVICLVQSPLSLSLSLMLYVYYMLYACYMSSSEPPLSLSLSEREREKEGSELDI